MIRRIWDHIASGAALLSLVIVMPFLLALFLTCGVLFPFRHPIWALIMLSAGLFFQFNALKAFWTASNYLGFFGRMVFVSILLLVIGGLFSVNFDYESGQFDRLVFVACLIFVFPATTLLLVTAWYFGDSKMGKRLVNFVKGLKHMGVVPK